MADVTEEHANIWILPLQERHPCGSFPKRQLHLAGRRNQIRQTPAQCWQTLQNLLRSSKSHEKKKMMRYFILKRSASLCFFWVHMITMRLALAIWCLTRPPPRIIIPVLLANTALLFNLRISEVYKIVIMKWQMGFVK